VKVGTGLAQGRHPTAELATQAVKQALDQAGLEIANSVLLFLSEDFAPAPQAALRAAAVAASTTQVSGCSAPGILTQDDWVLDGSAAAALVLGDGAAIVPAKELDDRLLLTLAAPNAFNSTWLTAPGQRFGGVAGDATGLGAFSVWEDGKGVLSSHCDLRLDGVTGAVAMAHALQPISAPQRIERVDQHDLQVVSGLAVLQQSAWASLVIALDHAGIAHDVGIPFHRVMLMLAESEAALARDEYQMMAIIGADAHAQTVTLAQEVTPGSWFVWAILDREAAQQRLAATIASVGGNLHDQPAFGLMFSCLARGPHFYDGVDDDIALLKRYYPGMPLIGFYGNGEIAPTPGGNALWQHSVVLGLFTAEN